MPHRLRPACLLAGCDTDDEYRAAEPELCLAASTRIFALSADGGQRTVVIDTNCGEWKVTTDAAGWLCETGRRGTC